MHRYSAAQDEAGHAVDAGLLGGIRLLLDLGHVFVGSKPAAHIVGIKAAVGGCPHQHLAVGEISAFAEVELHQPLLHAGGIAAGLGPTDQAMAIERVGLSLDVVDRIGESLGRCRGGDPLGDAAITFRRAELGGEVFLPADARAWDPRIEEIGPEADLDGNLRLERDRLLQPALADEAPGTDDVGYHVDRQGHGRLLPVSACNSP